jgi:hypothetical protein
MDRGTVEEIKRHFGVVIEGQDSKIQALAEGLGAKLDSVDARLNGLEAKVGGVELEVRGVTQVVRLIYSELTGRLGDHEMRIDALEHRER